MTFISVTEFEKISSVCYNSAKDIPKIKDGDIVHLKLDKLNELLKYNTKNCILISTRDIPVNASTLSKITPKIIHWFGNNIVVTDPKLTCIPLGIPPINAKQGNGRQDILIKLMQDKPAKKYLVYMNHLLETNLSVRNRVWKEFLNVNWIVHKGGNKRIDYTEYIEDMSKSKFVICPPGNGLDTHRVWESLYLNAIPIIEKRFYLACYDNLPLLTVNKYSDILKLDLNKLYELLIPKLKDNKYLDFKYWKDLIWMKRT